MKLNEHCHKPRIKLHGQDSYYLGMELEIEAPCYQTHDQGLAILKRPAFCHAKEDSSLSAQGWELVTQPIARNLWLQPNTLPVGSVLRKRYHGKEIVIRYTSKGMEYEGKTYKSLTAIGLVITGWKVISGPQFFGFLNSPVQKTMKLVKQLQDMGYKSHNGYHCGMHFHVSRTAFAGKSHIYWFARLVNGSLFQELSQRSGDFLYCKTFTPTPKRPYHLCDRYQTLNGMNQNTLEVRIFRGNIREERVRKNAEAVIAAVEFTRTRTSRDWRRNLDNDFLAFVQDNKKTYPNLYAYLVEIGREREVAPCV